MKHLFLVHASLALVLAAPAAHAQNEDSAAPAANAQDQDDAQSGNEIIVTAQRQSQRLQDVPVSVTAVSGDELKAKGIIDLRQLTTEAPSLQAQQDNNFTIRGIGTQSFANTIEGSVATAVDDVTLGSRFLNGNPLLDVARIEVLNGPQGLLFGKNASAGLVNITTARPELGHFGGDFDVQGTLADRPGDDAKGVSARATINVPVGANSALRVNGIYTYREPMVFYSQRGAPQRLDTDYRQYGARAKFLSEPTDGLSIYVIGEYFETHGIGTIFDNTYRSIATGSVNTGPLALDHVTPGPNNFKVVTDAPQYRDVKTGGVQGTVSYDLANGMSLSNTLAWKTFTLDQQIDADNTGSNGANINHNMSEFNQYSDELRLALPNTGPLTGQVGLYYYHSTFHQQSQIAGNNYLPAPALPGFPFCVGATVSLPSPPGCRVSNSYFLGTDKLYDTASTSYAAFGQLTYAFSDQFDVFAGGRVTHDKVSLDLTQNTGAYFVTLGYKNGHYDQSYSNTNFSWKVGAQFKPSRDVMLYATYGRGYKGPGMNDTGASANANLTIYPETTDNIEVGFKSSFLNRLVTLNASVFHTKFKNFQIQSFDPSLLTFVIGNAARVTSKGAEGSLEIRPVRGFTISGSAAYTDSKFDEYLAQCYPTQTNCTANGNFDASGYRLAYAPKFTGTIGAAYETAIADDGTKFQIQGEVYHRSMVETTVSHAPGAQIPAMDLVNGTIGIRGDHWNAALFCRNCTNHVYPLAISIESGDNSATPPKLSFIQRFGLDSVRTIGLRFGYDF